MAVGRPASRSDRRRPSRRATCSTYWDQSEQVAPPAPTARRRSRPPTAATRPPSCARPTASRRRSTRATDGRGVTVAIIDAYASPTIAVGRQHAVDAQGEPHVRGRVSTPRPIWARSTFRTSAVPTGWNEEEIARRRGRARHGAGRERPLHRRTDCDTGIDDAINYVIQNHVANLVSNSYGFAGEDGLGDEVALEHSHVPPGRCRGHRLLLLHRRRRRQRHRRRAAPGAGLPGHRPAGHRRRRHLAGGHSHNGYLFETSWGDDLDLGQLRDVAVELRRAAAGQLRLRRRWRRERAVHRAALPEAGGAEQPGQAQRVDPDARRPGRRRRSAIRRPGSDRRSAAAGVNRRDEPVRARSSRESRHSPARVGAFPIGFANPSLYLLGLSGPFHDVQAPATRSR